MRGKLSSRKFTRKNTRKIAVQFSWKSTEEMRTWIELLLVLSIGNCETRN